MTAPTSLAVGVDRDEYSRYEPDKDTIRVSVVPAVPKTDVSVASIIGAMSLTVTNAAVFSGAVLPFNVTVGKGASQETAQVTAILGNVLSLGAPLTKAHAICDLVQQIVVLAGELVSLQLIKARRNRDVVVATEQVSLVGSSPTTVNASFYLPNIVDQNSASKTHRGSYFIRATSITDPTIFADSADFLISIISVDRFRHEFLHGVDGQALDTEMAKTQPELITGVTIDFVSRGHSKGWIPLSYNISDPGGCGTPVRLLSWCNGPVVPIREGKTKYTLRRGNSNDYLDVTVLDVNALPTQSVAEEILIDREALKDEFFRAQIERSINWIEDVVLNCYVEPTRVVTEINPNEISYNPGSDIPNFVQADWDKVVDAVTYTRPAPGHWINFRMPFFPIIEFYTLYGKVSNVRILDVALEWIEFHERGGFVELVPFNQEVAFNFIGLIWVESLRGPVPIPNFWNFDALVGYRETPQALIELIGKRAAIDALTLIGQAFRPGISSQSVSRDGVSESVSYLTSGMYGIFTATIKTYQEWIDKNLPQFQGAYTGVNMVVV